MIPLARRGSPCHVYGIKEPAAIKPVPDAKRVRRDELYGSSSEAEGHSQADAAEDAEVRAKLNARLSSLLGLDLASAGPTPEQPAEPPQEAGADQEEKADEEEFEFRLFSTSSKAAAPVKVVLAASDDEDADLGDGAFTVPERPSSYYFAGEPTPEQLHMFRQSALAGDDVVLGARKRAWGLERPWRIIRLGGQSKSAGRPSVRGSNVKVVATAAPIANEGDQQKRKRPGKKRRIATRTKAKTEKEKREAAEKQKMTKEEHLKEKKKRLNREKKLKRRAKEREQKLAGKGHDGSQPTVSNPADSGSDDDSVA
ncbi:hypothetical protein N0V82_001820 [Gnomoniopsis sp. IMI 355080]|nr:hypothetical protein N0V82_001820 [Gnomoniopsis sp. IMI 355080]